jgi:hypothetical protein
VLWFLVWNVSSFSKCRLSLDKNTDASGVAVNVTCLITGGGGGQNQPSGLGTLICKAVKLERGRRLV